MKIITRDWIRDDAEFLSCYDFDSNKPIQYTKKDLCEFIDFWKDHLLFNGAKRGQKIGLAFDHADIHYTALMFAAFELGMIYVTLHKATTDIELLTSKVNGNLPLDFFIFWSDLAEHPKFALSTRYYKSKSKVALSWDYPTWRKTCDTFRLKKKTPILAKPEDKMLLLQTSGTTGDSKKVSHTHETLYDLCSKNWKVLGYTENDTVLNISSLNHGGSISIFQLPALLKAKKHYFVPLFSPNENRVIENLYTACKQYGITKFTSAHAGFVDSLIQYIDTNGALKDLEFLILSFISPKWVDAVKRGSIKQVASAFGSTETCGPLFISKLNKDTAEEFDPTFLGKPIEIYHKITVNPFTVTMPSGDVIEMGDELREGAYFVRKKHLKKINDIDINPIDIYNILEKYTSRYKVEIFVDEVYNELYILTCDKDLDKEVLKEIEALYAGEVRVTDLLYVPELQDFNVSVKADSEKIAEYINRVCRGR